jgi:hypothetical protein
MNDRLKDIDTTVDSMIPNDYINILKKKYESELHDYDYIDTLAKFSLLRLRGSMKYINKYDKKLRSGGLLIKIFQQNSKWIAILKKYDKKYYVSFDANYIFYLDSKQDVLKDWMQYFVSECDKGNYDIE